MKYRYFTNCINWPREDVHAAGGLCDLISSCRPITRKTFLRHVNRQDREALEKSFGYAPHDFASRLTMKRDHHVSYYKSKLHGKTVYLFKHSAIEFVFTR